jgi:hypothetical protein
VKCFSLFVGSRNFAGATRRFTRRDDELIRAITFRYFPEGFTVINADGGWFDPSRKKFVEEESRQIYVCARTKRGLRPWQEKIRRALHQRECLLVELGPAHSIRSGGRETEPKVTDQPAPSRKRKRR